MTRMYSLCNPWLKIQGADCYHGIVSMHPEINTINLRLSEINKYLIQTKIVVENYVCSVIVNKNLGHIAFLLLDRTRPMQRKTEGRLARVA